ncbi:twin-arginine translocase subunit TatC [Kocuria palustris]|uniref:twin-arginine translocase subunit TatC n=1 Tax=Kocuria palustris TaxID=71999 RepID=UPI0023011675|nr:twin-arginine translocase subunit TatC [Kocuria palustris]
MTEMQPEKPAGRPSAADRREQRRVRSRRRNPQAQMALTEHLRELRNRLIKSAIGLVIGMVLGFVVYNPFMAYITEPLTAVAEAQGQEAAVNYNSVGGPFNQMVQVALTLGVIISSPVWLYQIWAFIMPALQKKEKRYAYGFVLAAVPLFLIGCAVAVLVLPTAVIALTSFTPTGGTNLIGADVYVTFFMQLILTFGISFVLPVLLVGLNMLGLLKGRTILRSWRWVVIIVLIISAMAAPGPDMMTMFYLAVPLLLLFFLAVALCLLLDRRKAKRAAAREAETGLGADSATSAEDLSAMGRTDKKS